MFAYARVRVLTLHSPKSYVENRHRTNKFLANRRSKRCFWLANRPIKRHSAAWDSYQVSRLLWIGARSARALLSFSYWSFFSTALLVKKWKYSTKGEAQSTTQRPQKMVSVERNLTAFKAYFFLTKPGVWKVSKNLINLKFCWAKCNMGEAGRSVMCDELRVILTSRI